MPISVILTTLFQGLRWHLGKVGVCIQLSLGLCLRAVNHLLQLEALKLLNCFEGPRLFSTQLQSLHTKSENSSHQLNKVPSVRQECYFVYECVPGVNRLLRSKEGFKHNEKAMHLYYQMSSVSLDSGRLYEYFKHYSKCS